MVISLVLVIVLASNFSCCKMEQFIGTSEIEITGQPKDLQTNSTFDFLPINFQFQIPQLNYKTICECAVQSHFFTKDFLISTDEKKENNAKIEKCHYFCRAHFSHTEERTKCFFSVCNDFKEGLVWVPGHDDKMISLEFGDQDNRLAKFFVQNFDIGLDEPEMRGFEIGSKVSTIENLAEIEIGKYLPNEWMHLRLMVFVTYESFSSNILQQNKQRTISFVNSVMALVSAIYAQLKIHLTVQNIEIWTSEHDETFPPSDWSNSSKILRQLSRVINNNNDNFQLENKHDALVCIRNLDNVDNAPILGLSWRRSICNNWTPKMGELFLTASLAARTISMGQSMRRHRTALAGTISHELAHVLGFAHFDARFCKCPTKRPCAMTDKASNLYHSFIQYGWSDCAIRSIFSHIREKRKIWPQCLKWSGNDFGQAFESGQPICGNGIIENGEECDCGPQNQRRSIFDGIIGVETLFCQNSQCCSNNCKLKKGAQCTQGICCDSAKCQFYNNNTICRPKR